MMKEGYKKTDVGVIPEEWEVKPFNESFKHLRAYTVSRNELNYDENESCIYNIHYGDIHSTFPNSILDVEKNIKLIPVIINPELETPELLKEGDLIMADASEDYEGIGKTIELLNVQDRIIVSGTHTFPLRPITKFAPKYAGYIFTEFNVHKQIKRIATGISVFGVSKANISKIQLPIPPLPEQKAIADCLTTWDSGIENLSALIKAKKKLKKGLMQQLLTGEKRLDGFEGEWKVKSLEDLCGDICGEYGANKSAIPYSSKLPRYIRISDINDDGTLYSNSKASAKLNTEEEEKFKLKHHDLLFARTGATVGKTYLHKSDGVGQFVYAGFLIRFRLCSTKANPIFVQEYTNTIHYWNWVKSYSARSGQPGINSNEYKSLKLPIPSLSEQTAIAEILSTADKEIALLEKKLKRFKEQKRGLMQVLLTGERRLITQKT